MTKRLLLILLTMLAMAGASFAQSAPADTAAPAPPAAPAAPAAPEVNVHVDQPAPAAPQVNVDVPASTSTSSKTSVTNNTTVVKEGAPAEAGVNPWLLIGGGLAVVIVLLFVAMASKGTGSTVTTIS